MYCDYFNIDTEYFPAVTEELIKNGRVDWKKFYPHETFIKLLKDCISVLSFQKRLSIWVEGAYGTGKTYAVHTLKNLLEANKEDIESYFSNSAYSLNQDLCKQFIRVTDNAILTVHHNGSSDIHSDKDLILTIQESIKKALVNKNLTYYGQASLKDAAIKWLSDDDNKIFFNSVSEKKFSALFGGDSADDIIRKLNDYTSEKSLITLMDNFLQFADERGVVGLSQNIDDLIEWIKDIIKGNNLNAIVFIWDEFTEFFQNNMRNLTGFQKIAELSEATPFYFVIVTHKSEALFSDTDKDKTKILDRFIKPTNKIELPENMAIKLMGAALRKNEAPERVTDWKNIVDDLYDRTKESRAFVSKSGSVKDSELKDILPLHPYTALVLKHLSVAFSSNQRSMFSFIKDDDKNMHGFQWFIENRGVEDENPLLTTDFLWNFFYEDGKSQLSSEVRNILSYYDLYANRGKLNEDEKRVLKTVLLFQAISYELGNQNDVFIPNNKTLNLAFEGSDLENGHAESIAEQLVNDKILYKRSLGQNKFMYASLGNVGDAEEIEKKKKVLEDTITTESLVEHEKLRDYLFTSLPASLNLRYKIDVAVESNFTSKVNRLRNEENAQSWKISMLVLFACTEAEHISIQKKIAETCKDNSYNIIFVDASAMTLSSGEFNQYIENRAKADFYERSDKSLSRQHTLDVQEALKNWKSRIETGKFRISSKDNQNGDIAIGINSLCDKLKDIDFQRYPECLEKSINAIGELYKISTLAVGAECGITQTVRSIYKSTNENTKLENALQGAWKINDYWTTQQHLFISKIKVTIEKEIQKAFSGEGKIAISAIYDIVKSAPYGFMPCNLSAFVLGFLLKEYASQEFVWTDGTTSAEMSPEKLKKMIEDVIKHQNTPNLKYREQYIQAQTAELKAFSELTATVFGIAQNYCSTVEQARDHIRDCMKKFTFPIWCINTILSEKDLQTSANIIKELIDCYTDIANNNNMSKVKSETEIANTIGRIYQEHKTVCDDLKSLLSPENCKAGMEAYLNQFQEGELVKLASEINDNGQYINALQRKFDADAANWVWNNDTVNQKIQELILEYKIIKESNKINQPAVSFGKALKNWRERCDFIKIAYEAGKESFGVIAPLLRILFSLIKSDVINESEKRELLEQICLHGDDFSTFITDRQFELFKSICSYSLEGMIESDINVFFQSLPTGLFEKNKSDYLSFVKEKCDEYKNSLGREKLKKLWKDKTGTLTPREWSQTYKTPILCMIPKEAIQNARFAFDCIMRSRPDSSEVEKALAYLENADFYDSLSDFSVINKAFTELVIKNYSVLLTDLNDVREYLLRTVGEPYDWFESSVVEEKLKKMAENKYITNANKIALQKIDSMDIDTLKQYIRNLIRDNMNVGIEIIKS